MTGDSRQTAMTTSLQRVALSLILMVVGQSMADDQPPTVEFKYDKADRVPLHTLVPQYPERARWQRVEGEVEVCFNVGRDGRTRRVAVRRSSDRVFEKSARDAVRASTYRPLRDDQRLSGIKTCRTFRFHLIPVSIDTLDA